jgi:hypothetical protein
MSLFAKANEIQLESVMQWLNMSSASSSQKVSTAKTMVFFSKNIVSSN